MVYPPVFQDFQNIGLNLGRAYKRHGGFIGCGRNDPSNGVDVSCVLQWYSNFTRVPAGQAMTLPENMRAFNIRQVDRRPGLNPWYAPGTAHVFTPCGAAGGNPEGCPRGHPGKNNCPGGGHSMGPSAEQYYSKRTVPVTSWARGSVQNVAFTLSANHGGGYQYRICKVPISGRGGVTEECFQKTPLEFHGSNHQIAYNADESSWKSIPARDTNVGTKPVGSTWRRNPIPACNGGAGGFFSDNSCPSGTQFPAPLPGLHGFSFTQSDVHFDKVFKFAVVDQVKVPENIEPGEYVLSWRWDNEQTPQIWNTCSAIKVTKSEGGDGEGDSSGGDGEACAFKRENNIAYYNGDLLDGRENLVDSADICEKQCSSRADCIGFSYVPNNPEMGEFSRSCWLKNNLSDKREGNGVISGVRTKCDDDDDDDDSDDGRDTCAFKRESNIAYYDGDLLDGRENLVDSADICEKQCSSRADCIGFSYVPSNPEMGEFSRSCWLKNNLSDKREGQGVISGVREKCDDDDDDDDSDDGKDTCAFRRESNIAYYNGDLLDGRENLVDSADICEKQCSSRADCIGFSYVPNNPEMGEFSRSCWLKNNLSDKREGNGVISGVRAKCDDPDDDDDDSDDKDNEASYKKGYEDGYKEGFAEGYAKGNTEAGGDDEEVDDPEGNVLNPTKAVLTGMAEGTNLENAFDKDVKTFVATTSEKKIASRMLKLWLDKIQRIKSITLKLWFYDDSCKSEDVSACVEQWSKLKGVTAAVRLKKANIVCGQVGDYTVPDVSENAPAISVTLECPEGTKGKEIRIYPKGEYGDLLISEVEVRGEDKKIELQKRNKDVINWESEFLLENTKFGDDNEPVGWEHGHIYNGL